jgi:hypothetical protein
MTSSCSGTSRTGWALHAAFALTAALLAASVQSQEAGASHQGAVPDAALIQKMASATILCEWPMDSASPGHAEYWYTVRRVFDAYRKRATPAMQKRDSDDGANTLGALEAFGVRFDEVRIFGFMGGGASVAWSAAGDKSAFLATLRGQGYEFREIDAPLWRGGQPGIEGRHSSESGRRALLVLDGRMQSLTGEISPGGFTVLCRPNKAQ